MLRNFFKIFALQLHKHKGLAAINIGGMALALTCCLCIALFVRHELSHDSFFTNAADAYRIGLKLTLPDGQTLSFSTTSPRVTPLLEEGFAGLRMATRLLQRRVQLGSGPDVFQEDAFNLVDANFFSLFDFAWRRGNAASAYSIPNAVVLTESTARKYFGAADPLGEVLLLDGEQPLVVSGVIEDLPSNTHLTGTAFASLDLLELIEDNPAAVLNDWRSQDFRSYVLLEAGTGPAVLDEHLRAVIDPQARFGPGLTVQHFATPLGDLHMQPPTMDDLRPVGSMVVVYAFSAIGLCILGMAATNFVNISTARASTRGLEVGLKKALGATRGELVLQFLGEALLLVALAMTLALAATELLLPALDGLLDMELRMGSEGLAVTGGLILLVCLSLGLLAGWYPALRLSAFRPARVLKGLRPGGQGGGRLRAALVVLQFAVVIVLLVAAGVIQAQLRHVRAMDLGFERDQLLLIDLSRSAQRAQYPAFRNLLLQGEGIVALSNSQSSALRREGSISLSPVRREGEASDRSFPTMTVDSAYFDIYQIRSLAGRSFLTDLDASPGSAETSQFPTSVVLNEQAAREFGWTPEQAVGKALLLGDNARSVIGVVANTVENARLAANPIVYFPSFATDASILTLRLEAGKVAEALAHIDASWNNLGATESLRRVFLDEKINALYLEENRQFQLCLLFALLAIAIACLGLYGLAAFSTECRSKEIGVRKVMGGSVWSIVLLLTKEFSRLALLANVLAWPLAYFAMQRWLENFAYRIDMSPLIFIASGAIALCIAWVTVGGTVAKAASVKPVYSLRYE